MPDTPFATRLAALDSAASRLCVGVDPHPEVLLAWGLPDSADGLAQFGRIIIQAARDTGVTVVKPQVAFFERHGVAGMAALSELIGHARSSGMVVIADAKRGDVGSTVQGYAEAWLRNGADFESDALTAVAFQGVGSLEPLFSAAVTGGKGLFVLVNTSNPEGWGVQRAVVDGGATLSQHLLDGLIDRHTQSHTADWLGCVVGATLSASDRAVVFPDPMPLWVLAPGFGFQGASLADLGHLFSGASHRVIPTVSRSVCQDGPDGVTAALTAHLEELSR